MSFQLKRTALQLGLGAILLALSACGHSDLKAPCSAQSGWGGALAADCGPMRAIN
jgi:hypothetical protein